MSNLDPENENGQPVAEPAITPFDPARYALSQDFAATIGVKKVLTVVPCDKPNRQEFVRVRSGPEWRLVTALLEDKTTREKYLVDPAVASSLVAEIYPAYLALAISRQGDIRIWPIRLPGSDGKTNAWNESALKAAHLAETRWVRAAANLTAGMYDVYEAAGDLGDPMWPDLSFAEILGLAFKDRIISSLDHPVCRALRGEV